MEDEVLRMVGAFRRPRDLLVDRVRREAPGVEYVEPHGAFYFFFRVDGLRAGLGGQEFCTRLMAEEGIALVPGGAFEDDRWVRLSYAASDRDIGQALDRLFPFIARLERGEA